MNTAAQHIKSAFSEAYALKTLFVLGLAAHFAVYFALLSFYGPCVFFLSADCTTQNNDTQHYVIIANNLSHGHGYSRFADPPYEPDALRTPLLPLYFAPFTYFGGLEAIWLAMIFLNILLAFACVMMYKLARLFLPHTYSLAAALALTFEPLYLYRSQIAEPDALLVLLLVSASYFLVRSWKQNRLLDLATASFLLGLSILAKPTAMYVAGAMLVFEALYLAFISDIGRLPRIQRVAAMFGIVLLIVFPWLVRNKIVFDVPELSSIQGYNLYEYYTRNISIEGDGIPPIAYAVSREPSRYLPLQKVFVFISIERIKQHPVEFARQMAVGALRNLFVSDISDIYYYGHTKILPFPYNPETRINIHEQLLSGDITGALRGFAIAPKVLWALVLVALYAFAFTGWLLSYKKDSTTFLAFTMFAVLFAYLIAASGLYVDAKYRLPGLALIAVAALYAAEHLKSWKAILRRK